MTALQSSFGFNMLAIEKGVPKILSLKRILENYIEHQQEVVTRRTQFDKTKQKHVLTSWKDYGLLLIILMKSLH